MSNLKNQGKIIELPCSIGDTIYFIRNYHKEYKKDNFYVQDKWKVENIIISKNDITIDVGFEKFSMSKIGNYAYLKRSEAERALTEKLTSKIGG